MSHTPWRLSEVVLSAAVLVALAGCSASTPSATRPTSSGRAASLSVSRAWVKATDSGMTAAFADLENTSGATVSIVGARSAASPVLQLHETQEAAATGAAAMEEAKHGFVIAPHRRLELAPGGDHIMLMDISRPLRAGDAVDIELLLGDGSSATFQAAVKDYSGADETYTGAGN